VAAFLMKKSRKSIQTGRRYALRRLGRLAGGPPPPRIAARADGLRARARLNFTGDYFLKRTAIVLPPSQLRPEPPIVRRAA
jgi:hypothetical protein